MKDLTKEQLQQIDNNNMQAIAVLNGMKVLLEEENDSVDYPTICDSILTILKGTNSIFNSVC